MASINSSVNSILTNVFTQTVQSCTSILLVNRNCLTSAATVSSLNTNLGNQLQALANSTASSMNLSQANAATLSSLMSQLQSTVVNIWPSCLATLTGITAQRVTTIVNCIQNNQAYQIAVSQINNFLNNGLAGAISTPTVTATGPVTTPTLVSTQIPSNNPYPNTVVPYTTTPTNRPQYGYQQPYTIQYPNSQQTYTPPYTTGTQLSGNPYSANVYSNTQPTGAVSLNGNIYNVSPSPYGKTITNVTPSQTPGFSNVYYSDGTSAQVRQTPSSNTGTTYNY